MGNLQKHNAVVHLNLAERKAKAVELRKQGLSYAAIGRVIDARCRSTVAGVSEPVHADAAAVDEAVLAR